MNAAKGVWKVLEDGMDELLRTRRCGEIVY